MGIFEAGRAGLQRIFRAIILASTNDSSAEEQSSNAKAANGDAPRQSSESRKRTAPSGDEETTSKSKESEVQKEENEVSGKAGHGTSDEGAKNQSKVMGAESGKENDTTKKLQKEEAANMTKKAKIGDIDEVTCPDVNHGMTGRSDARQSYNIALRRIGGDEQWHSKYLELKAFHDRHGHPCIPEIQNSRYTDLYRWILLQQRRYKKMKDPSSHGPWDALTERQLKLLKELGVQMECTNPRKKCWYERYLDLVAFKAQHGHANVDTWHSDLYLWVNKQRATYRTMLKNPLKVPSGKSGKQRPLSEEEFNMLVELGVDLGRTQFDEVSFRSPTDELLEVSLCSLEPTAEELLEFSRGSFGPTQEFLEVYEDARPMLLADAIAEVNRMTEEKKRVPKTAGGRRRKRAAATTNDELKPAKKSRRRRTKNSGKVRRTNAKNEELWKERYVELKDFNEQHGHANVPFRGDYMVLYRWLTNQRERYRKMRDPARFPSKCSPLTCEELNMLVELGVDLDPKCMVGGGS